MQDQRSTSGSSLPERDEAAATVLDILLTHHPSLLHLDELVRIHAGGSLEHHQARVIVEDVVSELLASGLVHRLEGFVFPARAARRMCDLAL
jgi:hypothetical protein